MSDNATEPTVKVLPAFKRGDAVLHTDTGIETKITEIILGDNKQIAAIRCADIPNLLNPASLEKRG
jgi:hypothetical protein